MTSGIVRPARRPEGWVPKGPQPAGARGHPELAPGPGEDLSFLSGDWRIFQRVQGHRWSLDDLVTAWVATRGEPPKRALDLGCGIGSVLLMVAWSFPEAICVGVEAQVVSHALACRSIAFNGVADRVMAILGDLRDPESLEQTARFDLVTGTPPYFRAEEGLESSLPQRGPCRFEHRGGVEAYSSAAARALAPGGRFVMCAAAHEGDRVQAGARLAGLRVEDELDVVPREGKPPRLSVFTLRHGSQAEVPCRRELVVRDPAGQWTREFAEVRDSMGLPPPPLRPEGSQASGAGEVLP